MSAVLALVLTLALVLAACQPISQEGAQRGGTLAGGSDTTTSAPISAPTSAPAEEPAADAEDASLHPAEPAAVPTDEKEEEDESADEPAEMAVEAMPTADGGNDAGANLLDPELIAAGRAAYLSNYCGTCHRLADAGTAGVFGPSHDGMGTIAQERIDNPRYGGAATDAAGYIRESIVDPYAYFVPTFEASPHRMPPYAHLDADVVEAMVAYLLAQE